MTTAYAEKFKDPRWQKKRLEIFDRDEFKCCSCDSGEKSLNAHHLCYIKGYEPWEYENIFLLTLCNDCHDWFHSEPGNSEYFLLKSLQDDGIQLQTFESRKSYDIGGIMRNIGETFLSIDGDNFKMCSVERAFNKENGNIEFKLIEEDEPDY